MKLNIACPTTGGQQILDIDDEKKLRIFYDQRINQEVDASALGEAFKGYMLRITGGSDKEGFPMKQGVLVNHRVRLLLKPGAVGFRRSQIDGQRKRLTVRGAIVGPDLSVLNLVVSKKGDAEIPGLTDKLIPRRLGPKRASKIRKLFNLSKEDDVRQFVITKSRPNKKDPSKPHTKAPKIQRLVTSARLQRKRRRFAVKKARWIKAAAEAAAYAKLLKQRSEEAKAKRVEAHENKSKSIKLQKMLAIRKALNDKRKQKYEENKKRAESLVEYRKRKAERAAKGKAKKTWTPEEIAKHKKYVLRCRRGVWNKAKFELRKARLAALKKWRREKKERKFILKKFDAGAMPPAKRAKLIKKRLALEKKSHKKPEIFSKKGALNFLGKRARPFGKKARLAKKAKKEQPEAKKQ